VISDQLQIGTTILFHKSHQSISYIILKGWIWQWKHSEWSKTALLKPLTVKLEKYQKFGSQSIF